MSRNKKCLVCMKMYDGIKQMNICPVCGFQEPHIVGDYQQGMNEMKPLIMKKKQELFDKLTIGILSYEYEIDNARIVDKGQKVDYFKGKSIFGEPVWLNEQFETVSTRDIIEAEINISLSSKTFSAKCTIPNLKNASYFTVGINIDEQFDLTLIAKDESDNCVQSERAYIFGGS